MIVVDLGCFPHLGEISIEPLVARFRPDVLYGFDPWPALVEGETRLGGTRVVLERKAAWIAEGEIEFARVRGLRSWDSTVMREKDSRGEWSSRSEVVVVPSFDFSSWLRTLPERPIVKMDIEGAEFPILERMVEDGTDLLVANLLVEFHDENLAALAERRLSLTARLRCPVSPWGERKTSLGTTIRGLWTARRAVGARRASEGSRS